jgi:hypothetical protein
MYFLESIDRLRMISSYGHGFSQIRIGVNPRESVYRHRTARDFIAIV